MNTQHENDATGNTELIKSVSIENLLSQRDAVMGRLEKAAASRRLAKARTLHQS